MTTSTANPQEAADKVNILVVDDLAEKHVVFRTILDELDQNIVSARSGQEALKFILEMEFAVILLDVNMPDIDGLETASLIRQYKKSARWIASSAAALAASARASSSRCTACFCNCRFMRNSSTNTRTLERSTSGTTGEGM